MANQPPPRPWFRLASMSRPAPPGPAPAPAAAAAPAAAPAPAPAPAQEPRPPPARPTFRPLAPSQPIQTQEPTQLPPPAPVPTAAPMSAPAPPPVATTASVPSSPTPRVVSAPSASLPTSPVQRATTLPSSTVPPVTASTYSVPSSPKQTTVAAPSSSVPTSPVRKAVVPSSASVQTSPTANRAAAATNSTATARLRSPYMPPPKTVNPAAETPPKTFKPTTAPPPSPLILPPSQSIKSPETEPEQKIPMEAQQKTVLVQKTIEKPKPRLGGNGTDSQRDLVETYNKEKEKGSQKKILDSEEMGIRVITIAGENKGASMELIHSPNRNKHEGTGDPHYLYKKGNPKTRTHGSGSEGYSSSDKEGNPKDKSQKGKGITSSSVPINAFMNSNVQSINNSILYNTSCTHHDPGVHLALSRKPSGEFQVKDRVNGSHN